MASLFGSQPKVIPEFTGLQINTAVQVMPIPIIYGAPRVPINIIYYNGFNSKIVSNSSGKGISSGGKGAKSVQYFATLIAALGEGPISEILIIYEDANVWTPSNFPTNGAFFFPGNPGQMPWSYVLSKWPNDSRAYPNTALYCFSNAQLDASATVPQLNLVVRGILSGSSPLNNSTITISTGQYDSKGNPISFIGDIPLSTADADPAAVINDFLTNDRYGATFPSRWLDAANLFTSPKGYDPAVGDEALSTYCQAVGLAWSVAINNAESASSIVERWCKNLVVAPVWNGEVLRFIPYWDTFVGYNPNWYSGNGIQKKYFAPNTTAIIAITMDHILQSEEAGEDPITYGRKDPLEVYNTTRLSFKDRNNFFNDNPMEATDENLIESVGPRVDNIGTAVEFSLADYANVSTTAQLRRNIAIVLTYTWKMGPLWAWLDPMNVVTIPNPVSPNNTIVVRITSVEDDEDENITIQAEEFPRGSQSSTTIATSPTLPPNQGPTNVPASPIYVPVIFAPTADMLTAIGASVPQVIFGASGGNTPQFGGELDPNWGGCDIWVSLDDVSYQMLGTLTGPSTLGTSTAPLPAYGGVNPDMTDSLLVNLTESDGNLASVSTDAAASGHSICCLQDVSGFEVLAYTTATLIAPGTYQLDGLYRGLYGTTPRAFGTGSRFLYVGSTGNFFQTDLPPAYVGQMIWVKAPSFNVLNSAHEELGDVPAYQYTPTSVTPVPPVAPPTRSATVGRVRKRTVATIKKPVRR